MESLKQVLFACPKRINLWTFWFRNDNWTAVWFVFFFFSCWASIGSFPTGPDVEKEPARKTAPSSPMSILVGSGKRFRTGFRFSLGRVTQAGLARGEHFRERGRRSFGFAGFPSGAQVVYLKFHSVMDDWTTFSQTPIHAVFIDAAHDYGSVKSDLERALALPGVHTIAAWHQREQEALSACPHSSRNRWMSSNQRLINAQLTSTKTSTFGVFF